MLLHIDKKFGYYQIHSHTGVVETFSKIEAREIADRVGGWITYHFNDEAYSQFDWTVDIPESIDELYRQRAEQLRTKFRHVVLMYSGGYDSNNILETFVANNIKIDAIVTYYWSPAAQDQTNGATLEWAQQTWPRLQKILPRIPETEFMRIDVADLSLSAIDDHYDDYLYAIPGHFINPNTIGLSSVRFNLPKKYHGEDTCLIWGINKPRLRYQNNQFIFNFLDFANPCSRAVRPDSGFEYFYWSPDFPRLTIKQAQIARDYWKANPQLIATHPKNKNNPDLGIVLDHDHVPVQQWIYPRCADRAHFTWRPATVFGNRDTWIYRSHYDQSAKIKRIYDRFRELPTSWFNGGSPRRGLIGSISRDYIL